MARKKRNHSLKELYENTPIFTSMLSLISKKASYRQIRKFLAEQNFKVSLTLIQKAVKRITYARQNHLSLKTILDKRQNCHHKKNIQDLKKNGQLKEPTKPKTPAQKLVNGSIKKTRAKYKGVSLIPQNEWWTDRQVLDATIQDYYDQLRTGSIDNATRNAGLRALEDELKYNGDGVMSLQALKQFEILNSAHLDAIDAVAQTMMSPTDFKKFLDKVGKMEKVFANQLQLSKDGKRLVTTLQKKGLSLFD